MTDSVAAGPRITTLTLCDYAQVRESLLFVASGGVSRVVIAPFPAHIRLYLALVMHVPAGLVDQAHRITARIKYPDLAELIANIDVAVQLDHVRGSFPGEGVNVPHALDMSSIPFPRPGQVDVQVSINDQPAGDLSFWLLQPS